MLIHNLRELYDEKIDCSDVEQMALMAEHFAESPGRRPEDAKKGRNQVVKWLGEARQGMLKEGEEVDNLVAGMDSMVV